MFQSFLTFFPTLAICPPFSFFVILDALYYSSIVNIFFFQYINARISRFSYVATFSIFWEVVLQIHSKIYEHASLPYYWYSKWASLSLTEEVRKASSFPSNITSAVRSTFLGQLTLCCKPVFSDNTIKIVPCTVFS